MLWYMHHLWPAVYSAPLEWRCFQQQTYRCAYKAGELRRYFCIRMSVAYTLHTPLIGEC